MPTSIVFNNIKFTVIFTKLVTFVQNVTNTWSDVRNKHNI